MLFRVLQGKRLESSDLRELRVCVIRTETGPVVVGVEVDVLRLMLVQYVVNIDCLDVLGKALINRGGVLAL